MKKRYFVLAGIFLFNPLVSVIDVFPDFIGYLLLMRGLSSSSYAYGSAYDAHSAMQKMFFVTFFRMVSAILLPFTDATMALVFSFSFFILECIFGIDAYLKLFNFISYIELRCGEDKIVPRCERLKIFTIIVHITKIVFAFVPDTLSLFLTDYKRDYLYNLRIPLYVAVSALILMIGIIWFVKFITFINVALTEEIQAKIESDFKEVTNGRESIFFSKDFMFVIIVMGIASLATFDLFTESYNVLPDFIFSFISIICLAFLLKKGHILFGKTEKLFLGISISHVIFSVATLVVSVVFFNQFILGHIGYREEATQLYLAVEIATAVETMAFFFMLFVFLKMYKEHALEKIRSNPRFFSEYSVDGFVEEFEEKYKKKQIITCTFLGASCIMAILFAFIRQKHAGFVAPKMIFDGIFLWSFIHILLFVYDEVYMRIRKYS